MRWPHPFARWLTLTPSRPWQLAPTDQPQLTKIQPRRTSCGHGRDLGNLRPRSNHNSPRSRCRAPNGHPANTGGHLSSRNPLPAAVPDRRGRQGSPVTDRHPKPVRPAKVTSHRPPPETGATGKGNQSPTATRNRCDRQRSPVTDRHLATGTTGKGGWSRPSAMTGATVRCDRFLTGSKTGAARY